MFDTMKIAKKIRQARMEKNMTQMNLADALGVSYQAVSNWERGNSMPDISKLEDLCRILEISVNTLLGMEPQTAAAVEKVIREQPLTAEELADVAPILPPQTMKNQVKQSAQGDRTWNVAALAGIAPFLDADVLAELVEDMEVESLTVLTCLAPFLDEETLDRLVRRAPQDDFDGIGAMAPFLSEQTLDYLVDRCLGKPEDSAFLSTLAPFLSDETLTKLVHKYGPELDGSMMLILAPFLEEEALDYLAQQLLERGETAQLVGLYPFLPEETLRKAAKSLMAAGNLDAVKKVSAFL